MIDSQQLENHMRAESLREDIRAAEQACELAARRFATYAEATVEEQLSTVLSFWEARAELGRLCQQLLRLVCR
jgi:hypothetical protein